MTTKAANGPSLTPLIPKPPSLRTLSKPRSVRSLSNTPTASSRDIGKTLSPKARQHRRPSMPAPKGPVFKRRVTKLSPKAVTPSLTTPRSGQLELKKLVTKVDAYYC